MNSDQLVQLAQQGYNLVPIKREVLADFETPLSVYLKLANCANSYLLESVQGGEKWGRYSIIGLACTSWLQIYEQQTQVFVDSKLKESFQSDDPLKFVEQFKAQFKAIDLPDLPRMTGGLVGYFGYDCARFKQPKLTNIPKDDPLKTPDILLLVSTEVAVFDNLSGKLHLIVYVDPNQANAYNLAQAKLNKMELKLHQPLIERTNLDLNLNLADEPQFSASFNQDDYQNAVDKIIAYIQAGDCMQVVPSQRMSIDFSSNPLDLYRALRCFNPTPYMYFFNFANFYVVGSSPEVLVRVEEGEITVRPIAGTRPRGATKEQDLALEQDLISDAKELAEHLMLIDLGRNDVGKIAKIGTVKVTEKMIVERYSNVMHIVSNVTGQLKDELNAIDALRAILPAGTLSGAPKIRAMQIIDEIEPVKRGIYGGAVGYWGWHNNMDTAIAIRTAIIKDGKLHVQAGGGIVADSNPYNEWLETINKRRAMFAAVNLASHAG